MAFTTTNVQASSGSDLNWLRGDWTSAAGDTSGTVTVGGGRIYLAVFQNQDNNTGEITTLPVTMSTSGVLTTITVGTNSAVVSSGRFIIAYL